METKKLKPKEKRNAIISLLLIVLIVVLVRNIFKNASETSAETPTAANTTAPVTISDTEPATTTTTTTTPPTTEVVYRKGEELDVKGFKVTMTDVTKPEGSTYIKPDDGKEYVVLHFEIDNQSGTERNIAALIHFDLYVDQYAADLSFTAITASGESPIGGTVADGRKMTGVVGLEVDQDWQEIEAVYEAPGLLGGKHTFVVNP